MSLPPSFERFDYLLRANKHIERKIVFDVLQKAAGRFRFDEHTYLGFGSMWFADFRYAHKLLRIDRMVSIEHAEYADRASFNRPYGGIQVVAGECSDVLKSFAKGFWCRPTVAWLDYDGRVDESVAEDVALFAERCAPDSVLIVTVNANRGSYRAKEPDLRIRTDTGVGMVEAVLGESAISPQFEPGQSANGTYRDVSRPQFPEFVADSLLSYIGHKIAHAGRETGPAPVRFVPLFSLGHRDGAEMVTVAVAISRADRATEWRDCAFEPRVPESPHVRHRALDLVPITIKEKLVLDSCLPHGPIGFVDRARELGIWLDELQIRKYRFHYRHFPVFVEVPI